MKNHSSIRVGNGLLRLAALAGAGLLISSLALVSVSCTRDSSNPPAAPGALTSPVKTAGAADCEALSKGQTYKFESANYWDNELQVLKEQHDMQACAKACADNAECKLATYVDSTVSNGWANSCVLRKAVGSRHPDSPGICSWIKP